MLEDADHWYAGRQPLVPRERSAEWAPRSFWQAGIGVDFNAPIVAGKDVAAYVNHGRWIAECPDCRGAQVASRVDRRFMCHCCGNASIAGRWRRVVWPAASMVDQIEAALGRRPETARNWTPGETVAQLQAENQNMTGGE